MPPAESPAYPFLRQPITNGNAHEQALIRRWWHERHQAAGCLAWEYPLGRYWADAIWFPDSPLRAEAQGKNLATRFPLRGQRIVICEAKLRQVTPALIGQALVHGFHARQAGADVARIVIFAEKARAEMRAAAAHLGLEVAADE